MNKQAEFKRVCVIRTTDRGDLVWTARQPLMPTAIVPYWDSEHGGFGQIHYHWDGKETNVQGFPVYR